MKQALCFNCDYQSDPYFIEEEDGKRIMIVNMSKKPETVVKEEQKKQDDKIVFTACKGDVEFTLKVGKEGLSKILTMMMEG